MASLALREEVRGRLHPAVDGAGWSGSDSHVLAEGRGWGHERRRILYVAACCAVYAAYTALGRDWKRYERPHQSVVLQFRWC